MKTTGLGRWPKREAGTVRCPRLAKPGLLDFPEAGTVHRALAVLGVDEKTIYSQSNLNWGVQRMSGGFWVRNELLLVDILDQAHRAYKASMKVAHTDKGGTHERAVVMNAAWKRVKKLFSQHGVN